MPCNLNQLRQYSYRKTSSGIAHNKVICDRETGKLIRIEFPSFDVFMSDSSLSLRTDLSSMSPDKLILWLKCLLIIQALLELPESALALQEASEELEGIFRFYQNRLPQDNLSVITSNKIKSKLRATEIRPAFTLEL